MLRTGWVVVATMPASLSRSIVMVVSATWTGRTRLA
jgi:hypothetical protein